MQQSQIALHAFLSAKLAERDNVADEQTIKSLLAAISLEKGAPNESEQTRSIAIEEDTDGKVSAKRFSLYNLMRVSFYDLVGFGIKEMTAILTEDTRLKIMFSLLILLHDFYPKLNYDFNDQDAKILLAIYDLGKKEFSLPELAENYLRQFGQALPETQLTRSLHFFKDLHAVRYLGNGKFYLREKMTYERN